ncbi:hypothetical protein V1506DRAFT_507152 [Lipomyces tetrasporus]
MGSSAQRVPPPIDSELVAIDLTNGEVTDDLQDANALSATLQPGMNVQPASTILQPVVNATPIRRKISEEQTAAAPQLENVGVAKKQVQFGEKFPERDEVLLLEIVGMDNKPYLSTHGDEMVGWKELAMRCMATLKRSLEKHAEHVSWLEKASGVEVEVTDLIWIREDVYELAQNLDKTIRDVAMHRFSQKQYYRLSSATLPSMSASSSSPTPGTSSSADNSGMLSTTKKRKRRRSSNENTAEILLKRQLGDSLTEVIEILKDLRSQGQQLLDAIFAEVGG